MTSIIPPVFRTPTEADPLRVLALGAGVQSSYLFLASCFGELPKLDCAIFADTQYEPEAVYRHLDWLETVGAKAGIPIIRCGVGDLRQDAIDFRQDRVSRDGKRWASVPFYVKNQDGSRGQIRRQCTPTYKIEPMERVIREQMLGLKRGERSKPVPVIEQWIGISFEESRRCSHPGIWTKKKTWGVDLFGNKIVTEEQKIWRPLRWKCHAYPLCKWRFNADRTVEPLDYLKAPMNRDGCMIWLKRKYPGREIPRSACIGCPYRSNHEWRLMRDNDPASWAEAVEFDRQIRIKDQSGQVKRKLLVGLPFIHDTLIPLDMVNLDVDDGKRGAGCGIVIDKSGMQEGELFAGMCGV